MSFKKKLYSLIIASVLLLSGCNKIEYAVIEPSTSDISVQVTPDIDEPPTNSSKIEETLSETESAATTSTAAVQITDGDDLALFVVNENNPLPDSYTIETKTVYKHCELDIRCADYAIAMIKAALDDGIELNVTSGYRSIEKQRKNIEFYIEKYMSEGLSYEEAETLTYSQVAKPGCSEHNAGVAMDIVTQNWFLYYTELTEDFQYTDEFRWLQDNSWKYGFIMSFPEGKEDITGFLYEPWHYRFVGLEHAEKIHSLNITLNEYIEEYCD